MFATTIGLQCRRKSGRSPIVYSYWQNRHYELLNDNDRWQYGKADRNRKTRQSQIKLQSILTQTQTISQSNYFSNDVRTRIIRSIGSYLSSVWSHFSMCRCCDSVANCYGLEPRTVWFTFWKFTWKAAIKQVRFEVFDNEHLFQNRHLIPWHRKGGLIVAVVYNFFQTRGWFFNVFRQIFEGEQQMAEVDGGTLPDRFDPWRTETFRQFQRPKQET